MSSFRDRLWHAAWHASELHEAHLILQLTPVLTMVSKTGVTLTCSPLDVLI